MIEWRGATVMVDGGPGYAKVISPFLKHEGIRRIDLVVLTHPDQDHIAGLLTMAEESDFTIGTLVLADSSLQDCEDREKLAALVEAKQGTVLYCGKGDEFTFGSGKKQGRIRFLWPNGESQSEEAGELTSEEADSTLVPTSMNTSSLVSEVRLGEMTLLLPGDIDRQTERELAAEWQGESVTVLKLAHHGSDSSSDPLFLEALSPELCVISCGKNNRYGHPSTETLEELEKQGLAWRCTKDHGCIRIRIRDNRRIYCQYSG